MKTVPVLLAGLYLAGFPAFGAPAAFTVHEWGTFTTVHAPDGTLLPRLERGAESGIGQFCFLFRRATA